ncbi:MAG TPA: hypothetical protein VHI52_13420 [Verrucomicrobiae bacterium]|nr:hypothetical protein [Verrucomicrobiae bacterium]
MNLRVSPSMSADGWRLAPAYEINPNIERGHHHPLGITRGGQAGRRNAFDRIPAD